MRRPLAGLGLLLAVGLLAFYGVTMPRGLPAAALAALPPGDAARGARIFWAGGCASCHAAVGAKGADRLKLGGGRVLRTGFGNFPVPNISNGPEGIGDWSAADLANAMQRGITPEGRHLYPAFPYASYVRMHPDDIADLRSFLATLPAVAGAQPSPSLKFPFNIRRGLGLWKLAFLDAAPAVSLANPDPEVAAGQYLAEGPGHCGECHTPRNRAGALDTGRWFAGAPAPEGDGKIPNITSGEGGIGTWSPEDIADYFETGFTPDFDAVGGAMVEVQENLAMLPETDRTAIAAYLKAVPPQATPR